MCCMVFFKTNRNVLVKSYQILNVIQGLLGIFKSYSFPQLSSKDFHITLDVLLEFCQKAVETNSLSAGRRSFMG